MIMIKTNEFRLKLYPNDFKKVRDFYENILGLRFKFQEGQWIEFDLGGTSFAILKREPGKGPLKPQKMRTMFQVKDIEKMKLKLLEHKVKLIGDIRKEKYGKLLTFEDPNGHWLELFEPSENLAATFK